MDEVSGQAQWRVFAAGFNGFEQIKSDEAKEDVGNFEEVVHDAPEDGAGQEKQCPQVFYASWSSTAILNNWKLRSLGFQKFSTDMPTVRELISPVGDHNGLIGCLDRSGQIYCLTASDPVSSSGEQTSPLICVSSADSPPISHIARANNERVAVTFKQAPNAQLTHIAEFLSFEAFRQWHNDPSGEGNYPVAHHMMRGRPKQLLANAATFILLMETGEVYTWGDPRFRTLARSTAGDDGVPAAKPGMVEALAGLHIEQVSCGGWLGAALSEGAMYLWGTSTPDGEGTIRCLKDAGAGEVVLVDIPDDKGEPRDIMAVAVGNNHVAAVTADGKLFVVGDNRNGQLGLGSKWAFVDNWTPVELPIKVQGVCCGPKATFVTAS